MAEIIEKNMDRPLPAIPWPRRKEQCCSRRMGRAKSSPHPASGHSFIDHQHGRCRVRSNGATRRRRGPHRRRSCSASVRSFAGRLPRGISSVLRGSQWCCSPFASRQCVCCTDLSSRWTVLVGLARPPFRRQRVAGLHLRAVAATACCTQEQATAGATSQRPNIIIIDCCCGACSECGRGARDSAASR